MQSNSSRGPASCRNSLDLALREVGALARRPDPETASWYAAKRAILESANFLRQETEQFTPPIELSKIAQLRRIQRTELFSGDLGPHAVLVPTPQGFIVKLSKGRAPVRIRSSMAHEIGHTFFYDLRKSPPARLVTWRRSGSLSFKEEDICKAFARELLMPRELVEAEIQGADRSALDLLSHLGKEFAVSVEFGAVRLMWDFKHLETTVAMFAEKSHSGGDVAIGLRKYLGSRVKHLRRAETRVVKLVGDVIAGGPPFESIENIALQNADLVHVEWRVDVTRQMQSVIALLGFHR